MCNQKNLEVMVIDADQASCREVCTLLGQGNYRATPLYSLPDLEKHLAVQPSGVVILDLDTVPVDNHFFRDLKKRHRGICILVASSLPYHPGLAESMASYIYVCLAKPLDMEELGYWLRIIRESQTESPPGTPER
ncbi:MAG: response regulator [Desulfobaccales bacterium]